MKKKISILTLTILFVLSTTGMPIWSHYCEMVGKRSISECEMCKAEIEKVEPPCCSEIIPETETKITDAKTSCCIDKFDYKKIDDNFFQTINSNLVANCSIITDNDVSSFNSQDEQKYSQQANYNLPPPKFGRQLLHIIHQLKIDLPIC